MLFELLAGAPPFGGEGDELRAAHAGASRPALSAWRPDLPPSLDGLLAASMAIDPAQRPQRASDVTRAVAAALGVAIVDDETAPAVPGPIAGARTETDVDEPYH